LIADAFTQAVNEEDVVVNIGGVDHTPSQAATSAQRGVFELQVVVKDSLVPGNHPLTVTQGNRTSAAVVIPVR
jgi:uncharacterized protein (TIGR03437 family)